MRGPKPELQPCADCGQLCHEIDSPRSEHAADCPHWEEAEVSILVLQDRVAKLEATITRAIEMLSGNEGGPVEGIDWSWEINAMRDVLKNK